MTHFENNEHKSTIVHENNKSHESQEQKGEKNSCKKSLNNFQKFLAVAVIIQVLLLLFVAVKISAFSGSGVNIGNDVAIPSADTAQPSAPIPTPTVTMSELVDDDAVKGNINAPVTIVEFSDYECPFCERFYSQTFNQIDQKYIQTGKVKFIYRDFPLSFHQNAQKAAEAAECAGEQNKYYEMNAKLFESGVDGGVTTFKRYAQDIGLNTAEFNICLDSDAMASEVQQDFLDGQRAGVQGTPAFFINGIEVSGAQPFSVFEQVIEGELAK